MASHNLMDGDTAAMRAFAATTMDAGVMQSADVGCGALEGCKNFLLADNQAAQNLLSYVSVANPGIEQYNLAANHSGLAYQDSAVVAQGAIEGVEWTGPGGN